MSKLQLNAIITRALVDEEFRAGILNGKRKALLSAYPLPTEVMHKVLVIRANDMDGFVGGVMVIMNEAKHQSKPLTTFEAQSLLGTST